MRCAWAGVIFYDIGVELQWYSTTMVQWYSGAVVSQQLVDCRDGSGSSDFNIRISRYIR